MWKKRCCSILTSASDNEDADPTVIKLLLQQQQLNVNYRIRTTKLKWKLILSAALTASRILRKPGGLVIHTHTHTSILPLHQIATFAKISNSNSDTHYTLPHQSINQPINTQSHTHTHTHTHTYPSIHLLPKISKLFQKFPKILTKK